jgi:hypothetical protein
MLESRIDQAGQKRWNKAERGDVGEEKLKFAGRRRML